MFTRLFRSLRKFFSKIKKPNHLQIRIDQLEGERASYLAQIAGCQVQLAQTSKELQVVKKELARERKAVVNYRELINIPAGKENHMYCKGCKYGLLSGKERLRKFLAISNTGCLIDVKDTKQSAHDVVEEHESPEVKEIEGNENVSVSFEKMKSEDSEIKKQPMSKVSSFADEDKISNVELS